MTNKTNPNDPISNIEEEDWFHNEYVGLTKREYFAAMVLQGLSSNSALNDVEFIKLSTYAKEQADSLIRVLNGEE